MAQENTSDFNVCYEMLKNENLYSYMFWTWNPLYSTFAWHPALANFDFKSQLLWKINKTTLHDTSDVLTAGVCTRIVGLIIMYLSLKYLEWNLAAVYEEIIIPHPF